jgi:hypothetical protein
MDDKPATPARYPPRSAGLGSILMWFGIAFVLYVLSTGPVVRCLDGVPGGERIITTVYFPLIVLADACEPAKDFFRWYARLWGIK